MKRRTFLLSTTLFIAFSGVPLSALADSNTASSTCAAPANEVDPGVCLAKANAASLESARHIFYAALDDPKLIGDADQAFRSLNDDQEKSPTTQMYLAAIEALNAQQTVWPLRKRRLIDEALVQADEIIKQDPQNFEIRMLHASILYDLPGFFGRKSDAQRELGDLAKKFDTESKAYSNEVRLNWLSFFLENHIVEDPQHFKDLYLAMGGDLHDLEL